MIEFPRMARILVVDDERDVVTMLKFMFEKDGHDVDMAYDGVAALAALGIEPPDATKILPDVAIMDMMMPELDGYAVCAKMGEGPRTRTIPVVMLSANSGEKSAAHPLPHVAARIDKPFDPRVLRKTVADLLSGKP